MKYIDGIHPASDQEVKLRRFLDMVIRIPIEGISLNYDHPMVKEAQWNYERTIKFPRGSYEV